VSHISVPQVNDEYTSILDVPLKIDVAAAIALARVIRRLRPDDYDVDVKAWYRALDALSPLLPGTLDDPRPTKPATEKASS
jgi:hypothetical protein